TTPTPRATASRRLSSRRQGQPRGTAREPAGRPSGRPGSRSSTMVPEHAPRIRGSPPARSHWTPRVAWPTAILATLPARSVTPAATCPTPASQPVVVWIFLPSNISTKTPRGGNDCPIQLEPALGRHADLDPCNVGLDR